MLLPQHQALLEQSGISVEVAEKRGYFSATTGAALRSMGFGRSQLSVPALVIPQHDVAGQSCGYQARPDNPRQVRGKTVKYETPTKQANRIDVPPPVRDLLDDPAVPIIFTEGSRKADAAASRGMCCLSLNGVYGWRGTNGNGGKTVLPDFGLIALNDRPVILCFDSDVMTKPEVHQALSGLAAFLQMRHAKVSFAYLPARPSGAKTGLDDWLAEDTTRRFADLDALCRPGLDPLEDEREDTFDDIEEESGSQLLGDVGRFLRRYVVFPDDHAATAVATWILHTHAIDSFDITPRLHVRSPDKRSGKTRLMEVLGFLCRRSELSVNLSPSYLFRSVEMSCPTLLVDEVDGIFGRNANNHEDLRSLINAGFTRGATAGRIEGEGSNLTPRKFNVFCPIALAGIGSVPDTINDRCIPIRMRRRSKKESVERMRRRLIGPEADMLRRRIEAWAKRNRDLLTAHMPVMPDGVADRPADVWEPLVSIADICGGVFPERVRTACVALNVVQADSDESLGRLLLTDIRDIFAAGNLDRVPSKILCERLRDIEESPWDGWHKGRGFQPNDLARMLRSFDIRPEVIRVGTETPRGYLLADFDDAWARYLDDDNDEPPPPSEKPQQAQHRNTGSDLRNDENGVQGATGCTTEPKDAHSDQGCCGVADVAPNTEGGGEVDMHDDTPGSADALMDQLRKRRGRS